MHTSMQIHMNAGTRCERSKMFAASSAYLQTECKCFCSIFSIAGIEPKTIVVTSVLSMHILRMQPSHPRQSLGHETYQAPLKKKKKNPKYQIGSFEQLHHTVCDWNMKQIHRHTEERVGLFDDAVKQALLSGSTLDSSPSTIFVVWCGAGVILLDKGHPCRVDDL